jgi:hypothetical protein
MGEPVAKIAESGLMAMHPDPERLIPKKYETTIHLREEEGDPATYSVRCKCGIQDLDAGELVRLFKIGASGKQLI